MLNQLQPILNQATKHKKGRKAKSRPIFISKRTQVLYLTALNALVDELHQATIEELNKIVQVGDSKRVNDSFFDNFNKWFGHFGKFIKDKIESMAQKMAEKIVNEQKKASDKQFIEILYKQTGLDLTGLMKDEDLEQAVAEAIAINVSLIKSIPEQYLARVEQAVLNGLQSGQLNKTLAEELQKIHAITRNRAQLIATDQMAKINSRLGQIRQQKMGVTHYTWSTSRDERVRHSHRLRDGQIFAWDNPPDDGHAGMAIRCRCVAIPYTEHLMGGKSPIDAMREQENGKGNLDLNIQIDNILKQQQSAITSVLANSSNLIADNMGGLTRLDLPHGVDGAKGWTGGMIGLIKSTKIMQRLIANGDDVPIAWAIHHWSIDSSYLVDRYRKNDWLSDDNRLKMKSATDKAQELLHKAFSDDRAVITEPIVLFRGIGLPKSDVDFIANQLQLGEHIDILEASFNSNTLEIDLAKQFAVSNAQRTGNIPIIHKTLVKKGVKGIDITDLNYYDEQEILLQNNLIRKVIAMKKQDDGVIEMTSIIEPKSDYVGDSQPKNEWREINVYIPNDAHLNKVSGVAVSIRRGGKLSDIKI